VRLALVVNRASGHGGGVSVPGATEFALSDLSRVAAFAPERIAVAGGDGSIAPVAELAGRLGVPLAVIPAGTGNDFARVNGLPLDVSAAVELAMSGTELRALELGRLASGLPFVNVASAGLASVAAHRAEPLKARLGPLAYGVGAVRAAVSSRPLSVSVWIDSVEAFSGEAWQVIVACTGAFGGGSGVGSVDPNDGELDVVVIPGCSRVALTRRAWGLRTRTIERQRGVPHFRGRVVSVDGASEVNVDGEFLSSGLSHVTARANAFSLVVPGG
jgi:diacylglycerol kinase (ATP)